METDIRSIEEQIKQMVADVVIILHRPPMIDGLAIAEGLRFQRLGIPIILIDPTGSPGFHRAAISAGADFSLGGMDDPPWKETLANSIEEAVSLRKCQDVSCKSGVLCGHIFQTLPVGFALLEHVKGETGMPPEYRYLAMN
ncbi:MAG: hypothetical protein PHW93_04820 [Candidatus Methanomethylophilaceae archaeon]|nr:hypothetical protein [Candidatus Methanomethylophilaceae archaeon]